MPGDVPGPGPVRRRAPRGLPCAGGPGLRPHRGSWFDKLATSGGGAMPWGGRARAGGGASWASLCQRRRTALRRLPFPLVPSRMRGPGDDRLIAWLLKVSVSMHSRCCPAGSHAKRGGAGREWRCGPALGGSLYHMSPTSSEIRITGHPGRNRTAGAALSIPDVIVAIEVLRAPYGESRDMHDVLATFRRCLSTPLRGTVSTQRAQSAQRFYFFSTESYRPSLAFPAET